MELQLKNIGMIKEANVKLDGLTVIAGENDTGKSTVGKALFLFIKEYQKFLKINSLIPTQSKFNEYVQNNSNEVKEFATYPKLIFKTNIEGTKCILKDNETIIFDFIVKEKNSTSANSYLRDSNSVQLEPVFIESPLVWNFTDFFRDIAQVESQINIKLEYPYLMKDLNFKLHIKSASNGFDIKKQMTDLMGGEFKKDEMGRYYFDKNGQKIDLVNTATGIKTFGIFQVLSQNNYLNKDTVLILDEPEVHLHPKWQLEMAKVIVELVKNGVKVLVNSHSPYMIEALQRYSELAEVNSDFYLAEDGYIEKENDSNFETLAKIFEKLSEPFDVFEEMDSQRMENLLRG